jgi:transcriptional regulator with XRE-family HTH domain
MQMDDVLVRTGLVLRRRRRAAGLTLQQLSDRCGVAVPQLSRIENGLVDPRLSTLVRIVGATGGSVADLAVESPPIRSIDDVLRRRAENRARLEAASVVSSDPLDRLDERDRRGEDTSAERAVLP